MVKHLDIDYLNEYFQGDKEIVKELLKMFPKSVGGDLKVLELAIDSEDEEDIRKAAHKLKASFRYLGVSSLGDLFEDIEKFKQKDINIKKLKFLFAQGIQINVEILKEVNEFLNQ